MKWSFYAVLAIGTVFYMILRPISWLPPVKILIPITPTSAGPTPRSIPEKELQPIELIPSDTPLPTGSDNKQQ